MRQPLLLISLSLAVLLSADVLLAQDQVQIEFQIDPVLVQTGTEIVFTVLTVPQVLSVTWEYQGGVALGLWAGGNAVVDTVPQFQGRVTITATQLRIGSAQLRDAGNYTVNVVPIATTGLTSNSRSIQLRVFVPVAGVSLAVPSVAVEGRNVSLSCTWTAGTETTVEWGKGGTAITADSRITISDGSLVINPARRDDTGEYTCIVSNLVSAQTATERLTVFYGPDTPVLTKETPKECVGGGDVLLGQTARLTCDSDSLPPALFSWQRDGQTVASGQPGSGVLILQTFSTNQSGRYVCTARNSITGGTSEQGTDLAIVDTCLNVGEVVGIVIGSLLLIIIIVLLILLIVFLLRRRRGHSGRRDALVYPKTNRNPHLIPPDPQPNGARELGQGPHPTLYHTHTRQPDRLYTAARENSGNQQALPLNGLHISDTHQHNDHTHTNGVRHNAIQNTNSYPHNGIDNPAFTHTDAQNANTLTNTQRQNSNILIQAGTAQGGTQPPAVHVSLNTLPQTAQHNNNAHMPTIHVNLNSYPANGQLTQQDSLFPLTNTANVNASQTQQNLPHTEQSSPRMQSGQSYPSDSRVNGHIDAAQPGLIPTGYTHFNSNNISQRNADTQTYQQDTGHHSRSDRNSERHDATPRSTRRQVPWDRLRGTPSYPGMHQRGQSSPEIPSDTTDYTAYPPMPEARTPNRSQAPPQSQNTLWSRAPTRQEAPSVHRQSQSRSADLRSPNTRNVTQLEAAHNTHRSPRTQRESAQRDIRDPPRSQTAPRQEATHSNSPQALPLMSQQASVGHSTMSQRPTTQQGLTAPQGADTRVLADPNHLPQAHMAHQHRAAPIQTPPQGLGMQSQPVIHGANHTSQGGTVPVPYHSAQPNSSNLTQAALKSHTENAQVFQSRKQQTQAALLHPGPKAQAPAAGAQHPPIPPPVIPLAQFQTLPKTHTQHKSPTRRPHPARPPVNIPVAQRNLQQRTNAHRHPGNGHVHAGAHRHAHAHGHTHTHAHGHGHPAHFTNPRQQQAHRGRPR
ncbi:uncharacterized protein si:dkeyp-97a10.3 isoform X1 [Seriola aureovittata]|uniref:uncharacterized protein si:dkeyp-97a10.3 isoform X1 n=1 Tax=Seriola aureovittata TaxID=2871759 RepID=UPI0024BEB0A3|nr:uncharacterized protein si:dkeyp-97a10.3 isoform X1 [Seriola aureovittata]